MIRVDALDLPGIRHVFLTREGGVSDGIFASLNCSLGSGDDVGKVEENRRRALAMLGSAMVPLVTCYQVHGAAVAQVTQPWVHADRPRADAMVTRLAGVALGILTADCAPVLIADPAAKIVAAAHAGWRGALSGVLAATVAAMQKEGAMPARMHAAIGPCIGRSSYEVGPEFPAPFLAESPDNAAFFDPAPRRDHFLFDLGGYVRGKLESLGIGRIAVAGGDTAAEPRRFFSCRRSYLAGEKQFGHMLSLICLAA
jgi:YfiH family protein